MRRKKRIAKTSDCLSNVAHLAYLFILIKQKIFLKDSYAQHDHVFRVRSLRWKLFIES